MTVPFFAIRDSAATCTRLTEAFHRVHDSGRYILGPEVEAFEHEAAAYLGVKHAVGVSSGTDALICALTALGVHDGHEVIVPAFTFVATAEAVVRVGAHPVFADIDPETLCLDPADVERKWTPRTKAIVPVHLFGRCADMRALGSLGVPLIEDAAQAFGARANGHGIAACHSFYPTKNLAGFGDGGMVTTDDDVFANRIRVLRQHGMVERDRYVTTGGNFRLDALQAALLRVRLEGIGDALGARRATAARYLRDLAGIDGLTLPPDGSTWNQFVVRARHRDALRAHLTAQGIGTDVYYSRPLHLQPCFPGGFRGMLPVAEKAAGEVLALPVFPGLTDDEVSQVICAVCGFFGAAALAA